jgi:hypothetical protein
MSSPRRQYKARRICTLLQEPIMNLDLDRARLSRGVWFAPMSEKNELSREMNATNRHTRRA